MQELARGGVMLYLTLILGGVAAWVFFARMLSLYRARINASDLVGGIKNNLSRGNVGEAKHLCAITPGPVAALLSVAIDTMEAEEPERLRALAFTGQREVARMERRLSVLTLIAQTTPILGLIGAVYSLFTMTVGVRANAPLVHAADIADGLVPALLCAGAGLAVMLPTLVGIHVVVMQIDRLVGDMEYAAMEIVNYMASRHAGKGRHG
ncbi:MAG: MotA/TolQ/ExbB proton channel family protein [Kiritimatiellaeota bacterium]|nr:MotA/TolQ/ExbB proton channel family protein [Kiritimatiellota bacterium]